MGRGGGQLFVVAVVCLLATALGAVSLQAALAPSRIPAGPLACTTLESCSEAALSSLAGQLPPHGLTAPGAFFIAAGVLGLVLLMVVLLSRVRLDGKPSREGKTRRRGRNMWMGALAVILILTGLLVTSLGSAATSSGVQCVGNRIYYGGPSGGFWACSHPLVVLASPESIQDALTMGAIGGILFTAGVAVATRRRDA